MKPAIYSTVGTRDIAAFLATVQPQLEGGQTSQAILDSVREQVTQSGRPVIPERLDTLLGKMKDTKDENRILDSVHEGIAAFVAEHGVMPTADVVEAALQQGTVAAIGVGPDGRILDSATSNAHDPGSLQPNRAVVAVTSAIAEAIPFGAYLPFDIGSNEARLAIVSHLADSLYGDYVKGGLMDGVSAGDVYASSSRMVKFTTTGALPYTGKFSQTNLTGDDAGFCDPAGAGVPVLRGRTIIYVNGMPVCSDVLSGSAANSPFTGSVTVGANTHAISGYVTVATGDVQLTTVTPDFVDAATEVTAQGFVDYEKAPALIPNVIIRADVFPIFANPWRAKTGISIDAQGQVRNELGLDANSEAMMAIRTQWSLERHYLALRMAWALSFGHQTTYDFDYSNQIAQKVRADIWRDFRSVLANIDQDMAIRTMDHGITHLYVPAIIAAQMESLGADLFVSSGIAARASIYRVGLLFGKYEVYYSPKVVSQSDDLTSATILAIGRSTQVARCPIVLGDAIAPTFLPLAMNSDLVNASAMYGRDFTVVNPHAPSAQGCARINVINLS